MSFIEFIKSKIFLKNLAYIVFVIFIISWLATLMLGFYSHHGEAIDVPDLRGLSVKDAVNRADEGNLLVEVVDSFFLSERRIGTVIEQNPKPRFKVKRDRVIFLTINSKFPERIKMPDLIGATLRQATAIIETYGFKAGRLSYIPDISNTVLVQKYHGKKISPGQLIEKGSKIDLVIGSGKRNQKRSDSEEDALIQ
jgi:eukaryotic-like serine/threonine-protein kinase